MRNKNLTVDLMLIKKYFSRIAGIIGGLVIFIAIVNVLNYMYVDIYNIGMPRVLWHHFYEQKGKIDNIYLGSSHVFSDVNPVQLDGINGQYNFNLASSAQRMNGSYYLLKEADRTNSLSHVYLDLYYPCITKSDLSPDLDPINVRQNWNWQNTDYMRFSFNKLEYMLSIAGPEKYTDIFLPFVRYRASLDNWDYINTVIEEKNKEDYLAYIYCDNHGDGTYSEYTDRGYFGSTRSRGKVTKLLKTSVLDEHPMGEKSKKYIYKIIDYCKKRNIPITVFVAPISDFQLINLGNYDNFINEVRGITQECGVDFYDFNLAKDEYLPIDHDEYFKDLTHLNTEGAKVFTDFFAKVVAGTALDNEKYFYPSYAEKLISESPKLYGLYYSDVEDDIRTFWVASNREEGMEYRIIMTSDESGQYIVQEFAQNKEFTVSSDEHGVCTIVARMKDEPDEVQTLEIKY